MISLPRKRVKVVVTNSCCGNAPLRPALRLRGQPRRGPQSPVSDLAEGLPGSGRGLCGHGGDGQGHGNTAGRHTREVRKRNYTKYDVIRAREFADRHRPKMKGA